MNTSTANFSITLQPSKVLTLSLGFLHLLAIVSILFLAIPFLLKALLIIFTSYMAVTTINRYALFKADNSIHKLNCSSDYKCKVELHNGKTYQVKLTAKNWLFDYFAVLIMQNKTNKFNATIAKDAMSQEQFYALRLYLRSLNK